MRMKTRRGLLSDKIRHAVGEEKYLRDKLQKQFSYVERRWGHHENIMREFKNIIQEAVTAKWEAGRDKMRRKI